MNEFLANYFNTAGDAPAATEPTESAEKVAQIEFFAKMAESNKIDLESMSDEAVVQLWNETFGAEKTASDDKDEDDSKKSLPPFMKKKDDKGEKDEKGDAEDEKKAAAAAELAEKHAAAEKFAEAEFMGRTMAHAYVNELDKIAAARAASTEGKTASAEVPVADVKKKVAESKTAGAPTLSAINELAVQSALAKVAEAKGDVDRATKKIAAVLELIDNGDTPNTKIAQAKDVETAVDIRSLELLEAAGYPVEWKTEG